MPQSLRWKAPPREVKRGSARRFTDIDGGAAEKFNRPSDIHTPFYKTPLNATKRLKTP